MRYRKRPIEIDAWLVPEKVGDIPPEILHQEELGWTAFGLPGDPEAKVQGVSIRTLDSTGFAAVDDYVIRGAKGEWYPCRGDIFTETYDEVAE